jgi:hypothetical protein
MDFYELGSRIGTEFRKIGDPVLEVKNVEEVVDLIADRFDMNATEHTDFLQGILAGYYARNTER